MENAVNGFVFTLRTGMRPELSGFDFRLRRV